MNAFILSTGFHIPQKYPLCFAFQVTSFSRLLPKHSGTIAGSGRRSSLLSSPHASASCLRNLLVLLDSRGLYLLSCSWLLLSKISIVLFAPLEGRGELLCINPPDRRSVCPCWRFVAHTFSVTTPTRCTTRESYTRVIMWS